MSPAAIAHGSMLLGCFFAVKAWSYGLDRYLLLYGDPRVVVGASYTDIHVELPVLWMLIGLSIVAAFTAWANVRTRTYRLPAAAAVLVFGGCFERLSHRKSLVKIGELSHTRRFASDRGGFSPNGSQSGCSARVV
jgi:hypothetical protein